MPHSKTYNVFLIQGDGIGSEITSAAGISAAINLLLAEKYIMLKWE